MCVLAYSKFHCIVISKSNLGFVSFFQTTFKESNPELVCSCLDVIGAYVAWIEITLIANDKFVSVLLQFMHHTLLRESACDCIHEIISKGMDPVAKTSLIESFMSVLTKEGMFQIKEVTSFIVIINLQPFLHFCLLEKTNVTCDIN